MTQGFVFQNDSVSKLTVQLRYKVWFTWVNAKNFQNPELLKFKSQNLSTPKKY